VAWTTAVVIALIAGLIVIGHRNDDTAPSSPSDDLHWLVGDLPDGWSVVSARGPSASGGPEGLLSPAVVYATDAVPDGPIVIAVAPQAGVVDEPAASSQTVRDFEESVVDGVSVVTGTYLDGSLAAWAMIDESWRSVRARGLTRDELAVAAAHQVFDGPRVRIPAESLPAGLTAVFDGTRWQMLALEWAGYARQGAAPDTVTVDMSDGSATGGGASLTVTRGIGSLAALAVGRSLEPIERDGHTYWRVTGFDVPTVVWRRDGLSFLITTRSEDVDLVVLAASVERASPASWAQFETVGAVGPSGTALPEPPADTVPDAAPVATDPPVSFDPTSAVRDVSLDWQLSDRDDHRATFTVQLPDGTSVSTTLTVVADTFHVLMGDSGSMSGSFELPTLIVQGDVSLAIVDGDATTFRVQLVDGERLTLPLVTFTGEPDLRVAAIRLGLGDVVSIEVLDADGRVLQRHDA
jgi:translation initiation factor IF-1